MAEQTVAWVLHSLAPREEADVVRHLPTCPTCRALIRESEAAAAGLGSAVDQVPPPAGLRDRLLDAAERTPRIEQPRPGPPAEHDPAPPFRADRRRGRPGGFPSPAGPPGTRGRRVGVAFAVVAVLGGAGAYAAGQVGPDTRNIPSAQNIRETAARAVADAVARAAPGIEHAVLTPPGQVGAVAAVLVDASGRQVVTAGLPADGGNRIYVLWGLTPAGAPQVLGTFDVGPGRPDPQPVGPAGGSFTGYAISLEAGRSAPSAPSEVVASGAVRP